MKKEMTPIKERHGKQNATVEHPIARRALNPRIDLERRTNNLFHNLFDDFGFDEELLLPSYTGFESQMEGLVPRFDLSETDEAYELTAELPGMEEKDIDVSVEDNVLTVKGEKKEEREDKSKSYRVTERRYGSFQRSFALEGLDWEKAKASFKKGVLSLTLPKAPEAKPHRRKIEIKP